MRNRYYSFCLLAVAALGGLLARAEPSCTPEPGLTGRGDVIFSCSFEHADWYRDWGLEQAPPTNETLDADPALKFKPFQGKALRARVPKGGNTALNLVYAFRKRIGTEPEEIYFRYYLRFANDWLPEVQGGKLPGISGTYGRAGWGGRKVNGRDGWSARGSFSRVVKGVTPIGFYCYHADMKGRYGDIWVWDRNGLGYLPNNRWYCIEQHVRMNTPGRNDGVMQAWIDGKLAFEKKDVRMRDVDDLKIENVWLNVYQGGTRPAREDNHVYIDNVVIARGYIGPVASEDLDLILAGGRIVDGTGNPWYRADLGIRGGVIVEIGKLEGRKASKVIRVDDQVIAPGFIDMMGGESLALVTDPASSGSKLQQGITTMMSGEGGSEAPQTEETLRSGDVQRGFRWRTFGEYFQILEKHGLPLNVVHNVGAAQVRRVVIGVEDRPPTPEELDRMKEHVAQAMRDGAVGLSTALIYPPGAYAKTEELVALARVAAQYGGFYASHLRNESAHVLEAVHEALEIGEKAGIPVHIFHLKAAGNENWPLMRKAIDLIEEYRARGRDVTADIYPYIRNGIGLGAFIHPRHYAKGARELLPKLSDPGFRKALRREIESTSDWENWYRHVGRKWDNVLVAEVSGDLNKKFEGKSIAEIAKLRGSDQWTTFFDLVQSGGVSVNPKSMNEEQKHLALRAEFVSFCTDTGPTNISTATGTHPRAFGSYPRVLAKYVREEKVITLEAAIRKMTSLAANRLMLYDRGHIAAHAAADLVIFDPVSIQDTATFTNPLSFPTGISYVLVNGKVAIDHGRRTGEMAGRALRLR